MTQRLTWIRGMGRGLIGTAVAFLLCLPVFAQVNAGRISGAITDQSGGAVAGAKVTVTNVARGESRVLAADGSGQYAAPDLDPGIYTVRVEFMGFQVIERQNIDVGVGGDVRVDLTLQPGAQSQTVTVTESLPVVDTTNAQTGGVLSNQLLTNLPMVGRNYRWQQELVPGVFLLPGHGGSPLDVNGTNDGHSANYIVDGVFASTYESSETTFGGSGEAGDTTILPLDAIQEVNVVTDPKAEYGWRPGITASVGIKSGTNSLHGDAYAFGRDTVLDAKNAFATQRYPLTFEQFGATLGGPIKKDKIFYFMGFEGYDENFTNVVSDTAPTLSATGNTGLSIPLAIQAINELPAGTAGTTALNQLSVNLAGCNWNNAGIMSPVLANVVAACANGNQFGAPGLWNNPDLGVLPNDGTSYNGIGKVSYHVSDHHSLNASYAHGVYQEISSANSATSMAQNFWEERLGVQATETRIEWIWTPNSSWLNELRWGLDVNHRPDSRAECSPDPFTDPLGIGAKLGYDGGPNYATQYGLLSGAPACGFPTIILSSPVNTPLGFSSAREDFEHDNQFSDNLSYTRGTHQFKFGVDQRAVSVVGAKAVDQQSGDIYFGQSGAAAFPSATSLEDFLVGVPSEETIRGGNASQIIHLDFLALFAQDDWRITRKLTLNLGVRDEIITPLTSPTAKLGNFSSTSATGVIAETSTWNTMNRFLPRLGFAWDITGKGTTTIRSSIGLSGDIPIMQNFITGGTGFDLSAVPTGEALYNAAGVPITSPGVGQSSIDTLLPVSGTSGATKGIVISSPIVWPGTNTATTPLFPSPIPEECGNGLQVPGSSPAVYNPSPCSTSGNPTNFDYYHYMFWNVNFQRALTNSISLDIGYVGSKSWDITEILNLNQAPPNANTAQASASYEQSVAPYETQFPWFSTIYYASEGGIDNFRSLQLYLVDRPSHGLSFTVSDTYEGNYLTEGSLNIHTPLTGSNGPFGDNNYPANHLSATFSYDIPGIKAPAQMLQGWTVNGSINAFSATPMCALDTKDDLSGAGAATNATILGTLCKAGTPWTMTGPAAPFNQIFGRAGTTGTIPCYGVLGSKFTPTATPSSNGCTPVTAVANMPASCIAAADGEAPSPGSAPGAPFTSQLAQLGAIGCYAVGGSAIVPPAQGTYGTMLPYALRGAGFGVMNLSLTKQWKFKERYTAQFRFEIFNLFNRTMYYGPGLNLGAPNTFGTATGTPDTVGGAGLFATGGPRDMQFGLKLLF
jgi:hypothetical protein